MNSLGVIVDEIQLKAGFSVLGRCVVCSDDYLVLCIIAERVLPNLDGVVGGQPGNGQIFAVVFDPVAVVRIQLSQVGVNTG